MPLDINAWSQNSPKFDSSTWNAVSQSNNKSPGFLLHQDDGHKNSQEQFFSSPVNSSGSDSRGSSIHHNTNGNNKEYRDNRVPFAPPMLDDMAPQSISFIGDDDSTELITEHPRKALSMFGILLLLFMTHMTLIFVKSTLVFLFLPLTALRKHQSHRPNVIQHEQDLDLGKLNISSGKLTYRLPSPTRPTLKMNSFEVNHLMSAKQNCGFVPLNWNFVFHY